MIRSTTSPARRATALAALALASAALAACTETVEPSLGTSADALTRTVTVRRGTFGAVADTYVSSSAMRKNFGDKPKLLVSARHEALLHFDLASIPANAVIDQATLVLTVNGGEEEDDDDCDDGDHEGHAIAPIKVRRVTAPWSESTVTYRTFDQQFARPVVASIVLASRSSTKRVDVRGLVQGWVAGTFPNHGLVLTTAGRQHTLVVASEQHHVDRRPALEVRYTTPDDHCAAEPCVHGACTNLPDGFTCACEPGWSGATCNDDIDDCAGAPCQHGGTCTDVGNGYACACAPGYAGTNCETDVDDCAPGPCANDGVCTDGVADFTCACPAGWGGDTCADDLDSCAGAPCQNGGTCSDLPGGFTCACAPGFVGALCETNPDDCAGVVCENGGTCEDGAGAFTCACPAGFGGARCELDLDDCVANACGHGTCIDEVDGYTCACDAGFTGPTCEVDIDDCAPSPCGNGTCIDLVDGYHCDCHGQEVGSQCQDACGPGFFGADDDRSCVGCPAGTSWVSGDTCAACPAGTYSLGDQLQCTPCPPGTSSPPGASSCAPTGGDLACEPGWEPAPDFQSCVQCPVGSISDSTACVACPTGTTSDADHTACVPLQPSLTASLPTTAVAGVAFDVEATLVTTPGDAPVAGATISFIVWDATGVFPASTMTATDASGVARARLTVPTPGEFTIRAFAQQAYLVIDRPLSVVRSVTQLAPVAIAPIVLLWTPADASTVLSDVPSSSGQAGQAVGFELQAGGGVFAPAAVTGSGGDAVTRFLPTVRGADAIRAVHAGSLATTPSASAWTSFAAYERTWLTITSVQPTFIEARLDSAAAGIAGQTVVLDGWGAGPVASTTDGSGRVHVPVALPPGPLAITASFSNLADHYARGDGALQPTTARRAYDPACGPGLEASDDLGACVPAPSGAHSSAYGAGLTSALVGVPGLFSVVVRDASGAQLGRNLGCDRIRPRITGTIYVIPECVAGSDGVVTFIYTAFFPGPYLVTIEIDGVAVPGSPFALTTA